MSNLIVKDGIANQKYLRATGEGSDADPFTVAHRDDGPFWTSAFGVSGERVTSADMSGAAANVTDVPTSGQKIVVDDIIVSVDTTMRVDFKEETSGKVKLSLYLPANGSAQITPRGKMKLETAADKRLQAQTSAAGNIAVTVLYHSEA